MLLENIKLIEPKGGVKVNYCHAWKHPLGRCHITSFLACLNVYGHLTDRGNIDDGWSCFNEVSSSPYYGTLDAGSGGC